MNSGTIIATNVVSGDLTINNSPDALVDILEERGLLQAAETAGLQRRVIVMLAQRLKPDVLDPDQAVIELTRAVEIARDVIARSERGSNEDAFVNAVLAEAAEKTKNSDFDGAAKTVDDAFASLERRNAERREGERREATAILEAAIRQHTLRRDAVAVAARLERLVAVGYATGRPAWHPEYRAHFDEYLEDGQAKGINFSLEVAIECARRMVDTAANADERGAAFNLLGNALWQLGTRESGTQRLEDAVAAYQNALLEYTCERVPLDWAGTQNNLGNALRILGERESGTQRLEDAVAAYQNALLEWTRARVPLQWAMTQNNLGNALRTLGERESGTQHLEGAVAAFQNALLERTRERVPLDWAMTQNNLGTALQTLGERESGTQRLEDAVVAFQNALLEWTRERVPLQWATTQNNLGTTLAALGTRESSTARLEQAIAAWDACLIVATPAWPSEWVNEVHSRRAKAKTEIVRRSAMSQNNEHNSNTQAAVR
jgi:tetratricopeptide (TPR) repeat protein